MKRKKTGNYFQTLNDNDESCKVWQKVRFKHKTYLRTELKLFLPKYVEKRKT